MNRVKRFMATVCDRCPFCRYARKNPGSRLGRFMEWHGKWCPFWKAHEGLDQERSRT